MPQIIYTNPGDGYGLDGTRMENMVLTIIVVNLTYVSENSTRSAILKHLKNNIKLAKKRPKIEPLKHLKSGLEVVKNVNDAALTEIGERTGAPGKLISQTYTIGTHTITVINLVHPATLSVTGGAQWLVSPTAAALGAAHLSALNPLTLALSPWIGALSVYLMAGKNMDLKDIQQRSSLNYGMYYCSCRNCDDSLTFIVDRSDWKAFRIGISATVVGAPFALGYLGLRKLKHKLQGVNSKKHQVATALWNAAQCQGNMVIDLPKDELKIKVTQLGCPRALAIIATLFGGIEGGGMIPAIATICADSASGIKAIKKEID